MTHRTRPSPGPTRPYNTRRTLLCLTSLTVGLVGFASVLFLLPPDNEPVAWHFAYKFVVFAIITVAIALMPRQRWSWLILLVPLFAFTGYLIPRISWFYYGDATRTIPDEFYKHLYLLTYPAITLTIGAAFRLGGGPSGTTIKTIMSGIVILFSGFLDIMWQVVNPIVQRPDEFSPTHIIILTGRPVTFAEMIGFAVLHIPLLLAVICAPLDRWIDRLIGPETYTLAPQ